MLLMIRCSSPPLCDNVSGEVTPQDANFRYEYISSWRFTSGHMGHTGNALLSRVALEASQTLLE